MFHIIDSTLNYITEENTEFSKESALDFISLLKKEGITDILVSKYVYHMLEEEIPSYMKVYMELGTMENVSDYKGVDCFFKRYRTDEEKVICSYQLNDVREIRQLKLFNLTNGVLLTGLDDFICHDYISKFQQIRECVKSKNIILRPENSYSCATALAVEYVMKQGGDVITSFLGIGNIAATEQVLLALRYTGQFRMKQNYSALIDIKNLLEAACICKVGEKAPIVGDSIFDIESGIHVDGVLKNSSNYECVSPQLLGRTRRIIMGKHSGRVSVEYKRKELDLPELSMDQSERILSQIKELSINKRKSVSDEEFAEIVKRVLDETKTMDR